MTVKIKYCANAAIRTYTERVGGTLDIGKLRACHWQVHSHFCSYYEPVAWKLRVCHWQVHSHFCSYYEQGGNMCYDAGILVGGSRGGVDGSGGGGGGGMRM